MILSEMVMNNPFNAGKAERKGGREREMRQRVEWKKEESSRRESHFYSSSPFPQKFRTLPPPSLAPTTQHHRATPSSLLVDSDNDLPVEIN